ncbi:bifunctional metallophosphatase/5'-nucleotidase [Jannaschia formosa]|uniref:bifunctional metallophosphatase/5'-nucleotidase n=1 Tax=Jannaschia formosa TaxID=2259592 RepID=UPI000E1C08EC|nr:5'-nucleotidase C-terminal domain-containing protein [Jannaschia formosa]TFL16995.1 multifunctional 2',3'-cyclic-nucleotide 2'-phosphodiesterase/5'-nucleotidase/3'-nucleotidase [Jannaschia formosa]
MNKLLTATAVLALTAGTAAAQDAAYTLHILHINDLHSRIEPINAFDSTCSAEDDAAGECFGGVARIKTFIDGKRAELDGENVIVLDAGDQFQGSLMYTTYKGDVEAEMMNAIGFDAMAVGNHEFDDGPEQLAEFAGEVEVPLVSGNLDLSQSNVLGDDQVADHLVLEIGGERIGIVSALATDTSETSSPGPNVIFQDEIDALQADVDALTEMGVDKIIALTHVGLPKDREIAEAVTGLDAIVGGHSHTLFSNTEEGAEAYPTEVNGVPIVQAYAYSKYVGHLTLEFDEEGNLISAEGDTNLLDASVEPDAEIAARIAELAGPIEELKSRVIGEATEAIEGSREVCRAGECAMGNLVADAMLDRTADQGVTVAITNGGGLRASIDSGEITMGEVLTVLPFQNTLATFSASGQDLIDALENGVSQIEEGAGRFPQVAGMSFAFDASAEPGNRVSDVMVGGEPIDPEATYQVATNNYVRNGGDGYSIFLDAEDAYDFGPGLEVVVADYIADQGGSYTPYTDGRITAK